MSMVITGKWYGKWEKNFKLKNKQNGGRNSKMAAYISSKNDIFQNPLKKFELLCIKFILDLSQVQ